MKEYGVKHCIQYYDFLRIFGAPTIVTLNSTEKFVIEEVLGESTVFAVQAFSRFIFKNLLYYTSKNTRLQKRNNCTVETINGQYMLLSDLLIVQLNKNKN